MLPIIPKELMGKICFIPGSVALEENVTLSEKEQKIFEKFKEYIEYSNEHRFD